MLLALIAIAAIVRNVSLHQFNLLPTSHEKQEGTTEKEKQKAKYKDATCKKTAG